MLTVLIVSCLASLILAKPVPQYDSYGSCVAPNLIQNGDFENHATKECGVDQPFCLVTDAAIAPWTTTSSSSTCGPEVDSLAWPAASGSWSLDLNGNCAYAIQQQVPLTVGKKYTLEMKIRANNKCNSAEPKQAFIKTSCTSEFAFSIRGYETNWIPVRYDFTATDASVTVTIGSKTAGSCGPVIDDVRLTQADYCANIPASTTSTTSIPAYSSTTITTLSTTATPTATPAPTPDLTNRIVHYTCLAPGSLTFMDPSKGNTIAGVNYVAVHEAVSPEEKCNAIYPGSCHDGCSVSQDKTARFSCFKNGAALMDSATNIPFTVDIWWGFQQGDGAWACNQWIAACQQQCTAV